MSSTSGVDHGDEKKEDPSYKNLQMALDEVIDTCSKQKIWKAEWNHIAHTFHNRMKFLCSSNLLEKDAAAWGVLGTGSNLAGIVRAFGIYGGSTAGVVLNFWWRASLPSLTNWVKTLWQGKDHGRTTVQRILGAFGQPGGLLWIDDSTKSLFFETLRRAAKYVEAIGRGDVEGFYWDQMWRAGLASGSRGDRLDPMLQLAAIENKKLEHSQLDFIDPKSIIPGSDIPSVLGEVIAEGLHDPFFKAIKSLVTKNQTVKPGPPKTPARIRVKAAEYKEEYELKNGDVKWRKYRDSFINAFNAEPKMPYDFAFQVVDLARVSVTFNQPVDLINFLNSIKKSSSFEILSIKNLFRENFKVKPSGYRDLKLLVKFSCPSTLFGDFFSSEKIKEDMSFVCEIQCMLKKWVNNKKQTSLSYKLLRAGNVNDCLSDFRKYVKEEEQKVEDFSEEQLKREVQQGSVKAGLLLRSRATLYDISHLPNLLYQRLNLMDDDEKGRILSVNEGSKERIPIFKATMTGSIECVQMLLKYKADANGCNGINFLPLNAAATLGENDILSCLIAEGANIKFNSLKDVVLASQDECFRTMLKTRALSKWELEELLTLTVNHGIINCLRVLLEYYQKGRDKQLRSAFQLALKENQALCVQEFVKAGVKVKRKDSSCVDRLLKIAETIKEVDRSENKYILEFFKAAQNGDIEKVINFIERGLDVNVQDMRGITCMYFAAFWGQYEVTKLLLELKGSLEFPEQYEYPLFRAAFFGHDKVLELLLAEGSDPNRTWKGKTPLDAAIFLNQNACVEILQKFKAKKSLDINK